MAFGIFKYGRVLCRKWNANCCYPYKTSTRKIFPGGLGMNISAVQTGQHLYRSSLVSQNSDERVERVPRHKNTDTVHISEKARKLSKETQVVKSEPNAEELSSSLPMEMYALPAWFDDLMPKGTDLSVLKVGMSYSQYMSLNPFLDNEQETGEYFGKLLTMFREEIKERGLENDVDYYKSVVLDKQKSEEVRQSVLKKMREDQRMNQLMDFFGIEA